MNTWGERLKAERERLGYSQAKFGEACGVGRTAQFNYERGEREPGMSYLEAAEALGADTVYIVTGARKGDDWAYARAYKRILSSITSLLGLDQSQLDSTTLLAMQFEAKLEARNVVIDPRPYDKAVADWLKGSSTPDRLIDLDLLATIVQRLDAARPTGLLTPEKKAKAVAMLYRAFKASGKIDEALIAETVALAAT